jgi:glutaredoxin
MKLYIKTWCPWCVSAREWLDSRGYSYEAVDVLANQASYDKMIALSGQSKTPTLVLDDGRLLADFGPEELAAFVKEHGLTP